MHCAYRFNGQPCPNPPADFRLIDVNERDQIEVLLCQSHHSMVGALQWSTNQRYYRVDL